MRRVVVTGMGIVSSIGNNTQEVLASLREAKSGIVKADKYAELDVKPDLWFFPCHFKGDPVMPGCLGLDALWQLLGFFLGWLGAPGKGRALSVGEVKFSGMVLPTMRKLEYIVELKRVIRRKFTLGTGDGWLRADGETIYTAKDLRVGLFQAGETATAGA